MLFLLEDLLLLEGRQLIYTHKRRIRGEEGLFFRHNAPPRMVTSFKASVYHTRVAIKSFKRSRRGGEIEL